MFNGSHETKLFDHFLGVVKVKPTWLYIVISLKVAYRGDLEIPHFKQNLTSNNWDFDAKTFQTIKLAKNPGFDSSNQHQNLSHLNSVLFIK